MGGASLGDRKAASTGGSTDRIIAAYVRALPQILQIQAAGIKPLERSALRSRQAFAPQEQELNARLFEQFNPRYAETSARTERDLIRGTGGELVRSAQDLNRQIDPEFFAAREQAGQGLANLLNNINLNERISGGEEEAIQRSLNRDITERGANPANISNLQTVSNAMNFGNAAFARRQANRAALNAALGQATGFLPASRTGVDVFSQATGRGGTSAFGNVNLTGNQAFGQQAGQQGANAFNQITGIRQQQQDINAARKSLNENINEAYGSAVSVCCFIFMEAYNGKLPSSVRQMRDFYYWLYPDAAEGYKWMAKWLVPLMRKSKFIRRMVNKYMVGPLTMYGQWFIGQSKNYYGSKHKNFWITTWRLIGKVVR